jgi:hypothetical protein
MGHRQVLGAYDFVSLERAVAELQPQPSRRILDGRIDVARAVEVIRENLGEGHLGCTLRRPAIPIRVVGRGLHRGGGV